MTPTGSVSPSIRPWPPPGPHVEAATASSISRCLRLPASRPETAPRVVRSRGLVAVLIAAFAFELGHMGVFTYVAPVLARAGLGDQVGAVLLAFGVSAMAGLWVTGVLIDRHLRVLALGSLALFALVMAAFALVGTVPVIVVIAAAVWASPSVARRRSSRPPRPALPVAPWTWPSRCW